MGGLLTAAAWFAAIATSMFPVVYCTVAPWWRYGIGRALFGTSLTVALVVDLTLWQSIGGVDPPGWLPLAAVVLFASLGAHMTVLTVLLIRTQHAGKAAEAAEEKARTTMQPRRKRRG